MGGRLELEIRRVPGVLSCTFTEDEIVVLIAHDADPRRVEAAIRRLDVVRGSSPRVSVVGGREPVVRSVVPAIRRWGLLGTAAASVAFAVGPLAGTVEPPPVLRPSDPPRAFAPRLSEPPSLPPRAPLRAVPERRIETRPVAAIERPRPVRRVRVLRVPQPVQDEPVVRSASTLASHECPGPGDRGAPRARHGRHQGNGPRPWSRSVLVEPHDTCAHGR